MTEVDDSSWSFFLTFNQEMIYLMPMNPDQNRTGESSEVQDCILLCDYISVVTMMTLMKSFPPKELVISNGDKLVSTDQITGIIFVLTKDDIASNKYNIQGITNAFFTRDINFLPSDISSVSTRMLIHVSDFQQSIYRQINRSIIGQNLWGSSKVSLDPFAWCYINNLICDGTSLHVILKEGTRTEKVFLPQLLKQSNKYKVTIESIVIRANEEEGPIRVKEVFGRFCFSGSRDKFPKGGERPKAIGFGTILNLVSELRLEYVEKYHTLYIKCKYEGRPAVNCVSW